MIRTEDQVRDDANKILGLKDTETALAGVGQLTSFAKLGFKGEGANYRPDGWYLPNETNFPAIILEVKKEDCDLKQAQIDEVLKNCRVAHTKYKNVIGILYNGIDILVYKNEEIVPGEKELHNKEYYLGLFAQNNIDKQKIYNLTKRINDSLHFNFGIKNLNHRMIFTACALVAKRYGATLVKGMDYATFHTSIHSTLSKSLEDAKRQNQKLDLLLEVYASIKMNIQDNQTAIDDFIECVTEISDNINSDFWQGIEDQWVNIIEKQSGDDTIQWIKPSEHLSYQMPEKPFEIFEEDFVKTMMDYEMFKQGIDAKEFNENILQRILYDSEITIRDNKVIITIRQ